MSYKLVDAVFALCVGDYLSRAEKSVLSALCRHAHDDGTHSFASVKTLALESGLSERATRVALRGLEDKNLIKAESSKAGGKHGQTVSYRVLIPNQDVVAAVKLSWRTGASHAPEDTGAVATPEDPAPNTNSPLTGAVATPEDGFTGAVATPTGAVGAPKSVREEVKTTTSTTVAAVVASPEAGRQRASKIIEWLTDALGHTVPVHKGQRDALAQLSEVIPEPLMERATRAWVAGRSFKGMEFPLIFFINEIQQQIEIERAAIEASQPIVYTPEQNAEYRRQILAENHLTEEEFAELERKSKLPPEDNSDYKGPIG